MVDFEFLERFSIYKLSESKIVESFDCGDADLNDFIVKDTARPSVSICYANCSSLRNKKLAVKGAPFFTILRGNFTRLQGHKLGYE